MAIPKGTTVVHIDNPTRIGVTSGRVQNRGAVAFVEVLFGAGDRTFVREEYLQIHTESSSSFEDKIREGKFGRLDDLTRLLTFEKLKKGGLHNFLYSMDAARIEFHEYQFKPVLKFINAPTERLLIADEVGLGKTIEAALIWLEMQARHDARRLLVVCPKMIAPKWRLELREKFGVSAEIGTAENLLNALADMRRHGESQRFAWICTYSGLRPFRKEITDETTPEKAISPRARLFRECSDWNSETHDIESSFFDLVIFDEAHYMRNATSATARLGQAFCEAARAALLVTATPVNNTNADLLTLLRLLDGDVFESESLFSLLLAENRPAVQAANALTANPPRIESAREALALLEDSSFIGKALLKQARESLNRLTSQNLSELIRVQELVEQLNVLGAYISRTRRVQVKERKPKRDPKILPVIFSDEEMRFYNAVTAMVRRKVREAGAQFSAFHLTLPQQRMASCIPAVIEAIRDGRFVSAGEIIYESFDLDDSEEQESTDGVLNLENFRWIVGYDFEKNDSKFEALRELLSNLGHEKAIIFAYFKGTLSYLYRRLSDDGISCAMIHGGVKDEDRQDELERFRDPRGARLLLSSEVGSEGIDLQFCSVVVNYDLPWNPMRIEQRIGRIDRVGQKADRLRIVHFKIANTIEERLYDKLHDKLRIFESSIGDMEAVLGEEVQRLTMDLLSRELTPEEEALRIEQTEKVIAGRMHLMHKLETEGESLLSIGDLISSRVEQNRDLGRYVTPAELKRYINDFFNRNYKGCVLEWDSPVEDLFSLELTFEAHDRLIEFIRRQKLDSEIQLRSRKIIGTLHADRIPEQSTARDKLRVLFINHFSPLVRWLTEENQNAVGAFHNVSALDLKTSDLPRGLYIYRIERWKFSGIRSKEILAYGVRGIETGGSFSATDAEQFIQTLLRDSSSWSYPQIPLGKVMAAQARLQQEMQEQFTAALHQFSVENENLKKIRATQIRNHVIRQRSSIEQRIATSLARGRGIRVVKMNEAKLNKLQEWESNKFHKLETQARLREDFDEVAGGVVTVGKNT